MSNTNGESRRYWPLSVFGLTSPGSGGWFAVLGVALLYAAHGLGGGFIGNVALLTNIGAALLVAAGLLDPGLRGDLGRLRGLGVPALLFGLTIAVGLWSLTPFTPGGPHPVWAFVGLPPGASTIDISGTSLEIIKLLGLGCMFLVGAFTGARDDRARFAIRLTLLAGVIFGLYAFIGVMTGSIPQTHGRRLEAHFLNPNTAGAFFAVLLVLAAAELMRERRTAARRGPNAFAPLGLAAAVFLVCLLATASRGATTALALAMIVITILQIATGRLKATRLLTGGLLALGLTIAAVAVAGDQLVDRWFSGREAALTRMDYWRQYWTAFLDSPLFGYGLGSVPTLSKILLSASTFKALAEIHGPHSVYIQWLTEAGLVGAVPMFLCVGSLLILTFLGLMRRSRMTGLLAALLTIDAVFLIHGVTDFAIQTHSVAAFWAWLLGLQVALAQGTSRR